MLTRRALSAGFALALASLPAAAQTGWVASGPPQGMPFNQQGLLGWTGWVPNCVLGYYPTTYDGVASYYPDCRATLPPGIVASTPGLVVGTTPVSGGTLGQALTVGLGGVLASATMSGGGTPSGAANLIYATPNGSSGSATLRAAVAGDLPAAITPSSVIAPTTTALTLGANAAGQWSITTAGALSPTSNNLYDIGTTTNKVHFVYGTQLGDSTHSFSTAYIDGLNGTSTTTTIRTAASGVLYLGVGASNYFDVSTTAFYPQVDNTYTLGNTVNRFSNVYSVNYSAGTTNTAGVSCASGTVSASTMVVTNGIVTHC